MDKAKVVRSGVRWVGTGLGLAAAVYGSSTAVSWLRYGHPSRPDAAAQDGLLDTFLPGYEVADRHHVRINAPAEVSLAAACEMDVRNSRTIRGIFKARELLLGAEPNRQPTQTGLLAMTKELGWGTLAERFGREIVMGAVTRPWEANVTFRAVDPEHFAAFREPDYVKIVWSLRADPIGLFRSVLRTETRAVATDAVSRAKFRLYWSFLSPGIWLIRRLSLRPLKVEAERRVLVG